MNDNHLIAIMSIVGALFGSVIIVSIVLVGANDRGTQIKHLEQQLQYCEAAKQ